MILDSMFYNFTCNLDHPKGKMQFNWGVASFDVTQPLIPQLIKQAGYNDVEVFNVDLQAFNPLIPHEQTEVEKKLQSLIEVIQHAKDEQVPLEAVLPELIHRAGIK
jgi:hypothetical protein